MKRAIVAVLMAALVAVVSCREPTQIVVEARTDVAYRAGIVTSFTVGGPGQTEKAEATTETSEPWEGSTIGTLVVVPGSAEDATLAVKLVMGIARNARDCVAPDYQGCIVARRRLRYVPHEKMQLPITLYAQCQDVPCDELSTCSVLGRCVPAEASCVDATCNVPEERDPGVTLDGGAKDGALEASVDSGADAAIDANGSDGGGDSGPTSGAGTVACGDGPCPIDTQICCYNSGTNAGSCTSNQVSCGASSGEFRIACDSQNDCAANEVCCFGPSGGSCLTMCPYSQPCQSGSDSECPSPQKCTGQFGPYYRLCQYP